MPVNLAYEIIDRFNANRNKGSRRVEDENKRPDRMGYSCFYCGYNNNPDCKVCVNCYAKISCDE